MAIMVAYHCNIHGLIVALSLSKCFLPCHHQIKAKCLKKYCKKNNGQTCENQNQIVTIYNYQSNKAAELQLQHKCQLTALGQIKRVLNASSDKT